MRDATSERDEAGSTASREVENRSGAWLRHLTRMERRYFAIDGGSGALLLSMLPALDSRWRRVHTPRHADLLLIIEPVTTTLLAAIGDIVRGVPTPRTVMLMQTTSDALHRRTPSVADLASVFPAAIRLSSAPFNAGSVAHATPIVRTAQHAVRPDTGAGATIEPPPERLVQTGMEREREIATEELVVSVGPVQEVTAGPLRVLLICDGEQVVRAELDGGYAARGLAALFPAATWTGGQAIAERIDPLAPIAGRVAYAEAVEQLAGLDVPRDVRAYRLAALAAERVLNDLGLLVRFASVIAYDWLARTARRHLLALAPHVPAPDVVRVGGVGDWAPPPSSSIRDRQRALRTLAAMVRRFTEQLASDRVLDIKMKHIGVLTREAARTAGITGPNLMASEHGVGDVRARILARARRATRELAELVNTEVIGVAAHPQSPRDIDDATIAGAIGPGETTTDVDGPRGTLSLTMRSDGVDHPASVVWSGPSAAALRVLRELLCGVKLADALAIITSLDLSMAEAEG